MKEKYGFPIDKNHKTLQNLGDQDLSIQAAYLDDQNIS